MASFRPMLRRHGLTEQQWRVIRVLSGRGSLEVSELADATYLLAPSLSRILRNLETRDLVRRDAVASDTRRFQIRLTPEGARIFQEVAPEAEVIYASIEARFGKHRLADLLTALDRLSTALLEEAP